jgi:hypothetical protein
MIPLVLIVITAGLELYVLRRLRFGWFIVGVALGGLLVEGSYLSYTPMTERNYDTSSHVFYIDYLIEHRRLPPLNILCTTCGHPPLYYALAALWSQLLLAGGWIPRGLGLQWLSLLLSSGFVVFALLLLRSFIERPATLGLAAALVVFWPSGILNSVRVHNDALASVLVLASMYFMSEWDRHGRRRDFYGALGACALALFTKATAYGVAGALLLVAALRLRSARFSRESIRQGVVAVLVLVGAALLPMALRGSTPSTLCQRVLGGACYAHPGAFVANQPADYLYFDLRGFLCDTSALSDATRQDYFWNGLAKSSLFGVMRLGKDFEGACYHRLALLLSVLLLAMAAVCAALLPFVRRASWSKYRAVALASASLLILLAAFRMIFPTPFHEDFRHIFPVLVPLSLLYAKSVERIGRWSRAAYWAGVGLGVLMALSSVAFFVRIP